MNKLSSKIIADVFIEKCQSLGLDPSTESRVERFGSPAITASVRRHIEKWDNRRLYAASLCELSRAQLSDLISTLPIVAGLAIERTRVMRPARLGYRVYCPTTLRVLLEIRDSDIPDEYQSSEDSKMNYVSFWATKIKTIKKPDQPKKHASLSESVMDAIMDIQASMWPVQARCG